MATESLLQGCQTLIEKGQESWKSYFSKWESLSKYEENLPESELFDEPEEEIKPVKKTKPNHHVYGKKSSIIHHKKIKSKKKVIKKKKLPPKNKDKEKTVKQCEHSVNETCPESKDMMTLESLLRKIFADILKVNKNGFQAFTVLSHTFSNSEVTNYSQIFHCQKTLSCYDNTRLIKSMPEYNQSLFPTQNTDHNNFGKSRTSFETAKPLMGYKEWEQIRNLQGGFPDFKFNCDVKKQQFLLSIKGSQTPNPSSRVNTGMPNFTPSLLNNIRHDDTKLKSLEWDWKPESSSSVCRKINKEYFIKRSSHKMNIPQDGKRFRNLCLHKRTNSVTLSMENSNFTTPEKKPPERKCYSENVLQRKRRRPSKLFFGDEGEDSESDDQTETRPPLIHNKHKKQKVDIISEVESDSDDCESIFDRVKKS